MSYLNKNYSTRQGKFHLMMEIHDDSVYISKICLISQKITAQEMATFVYNKSFCTKINIKTCQRNPLWRNEKQPRTSGAIHLLELNHTCPVSSTCVLNYF